MIIKTNSCTDFSLTRSLGRTEQTCFAQQNSQTCIALHWIVVVFFSRSHSIRMEQFLHKKFNSILFGHSLRPVSVICCFYCIYFIAVYVLIIANELQKMRSPNDKTKCRKITEKLLNILSFMAILRWICTEREKTGCICFFLQFFFSSLIFGFTEEQQSQIVFLAQTIYTLSHHACLHKQPKYNKIHWIFYLNGSHHNFCFFYDFDKETKGKK